MTTSFKRLLLISATLLLGVLNIGVAQAQVGAFDCPAGCPAETNFDYGWATNVNPGTGGYSTTVNVNSTNYTIYAVAGSYDNIASTYLVNTPWFTGNSTLAMQLTNAVAGSLGQSAGGAPSNVGVLFAYHAPTIYFSDFYTVPVTFYQASGPLPALGGSGGGVAPEMNAAFIPQVALMLACLFFLLGRKKENTESMMTA